MIRTRPCSPCLSLLLLIATGLLAPAAATQAEEASSTASTASEAGEDWPRFLGPTGDGKSKERIRRPWPEAGLEVLWFDAVGEGYSAPSVADGRLFLFDRVGDEARLSARRSDNGEPLWSVSYPTDYEDYYRYSGGPRTSPVVDGDRVYVFGVEGRLRAHAVDDGALVWEIDTAARFGVVQNFFGVGSTPVVEGDLLIAQIGGSPPGSPSIHSGEVVGNGSGIVAFDKRTGEVRYSITDQLAAYASPRIVTIGDRRWAFAFVRGGLLAFEPTRGSVDFFYPWRARKLESVNAATPVVVGNTVFVTEAYGPGSSLIEVRPGGYDVLWKDPPRGKSMACHWSTPIHHRGHLYGSSGESSGEAELRAIEHRTGRVLWSEPDLGRSTLLYADEHFVVLTEYGRLLLIEADPERFVVVSEMNLGNRGSATNEDAKIGPGERSAQRPMLRFPAWNAPVLSHGRLYLRGKDQIVVLDAAPREEEAAATR